MLKNIAAKYKTKVFKIKKKYMITGIFNVLYEMSNGMDFSIK